MASCRALCQPYRPRTKGKVERFIRYLRASFYVPLASQLSPEGLKVDRDTANARVGTWLREVANARCTRPPARCPRYASSRSVSGCKRLPRPGPALPGCAETSAGAPSAAISIRCGSMKN